MDSNCVSCTWEAAIMGIDGSSCLRSMSLAALLATYLPRIIVPANQLAQKLAEAAGGASSTPAA